MGNISDASTAILKVHNEWAWLAGTTSLRANRVKIISGFLLVCHRITRTVTSYTTSMFDPKVNFMAHWKTRLQIKIFIQNLAKEIRICWFDMMLIKVSSFFLFVPRYLKKYFISSMTSTGIVWCQILPEIFMKVDIEYWLLFLIFVW